MSDSIDTGSHYRKIYRFPLTDIDVERGFLEVQLDPYALAPILDITDMVQFTIFKKVIRWGGSASKSLERDIMDIIGACERKLEILGLEN